MSGHSKWSKIKRQKKAEDIKRGKIFSRLAREITVAAKDNPDTETNPKLRMAIDKAKDANVPRGNIKRAIDRASGKDARDLEKVGYEGFGPGGEAIYVEAVTDNRRRTVAQIRHLFDRHNAKLGEQGSVDYLFETRGEVVVDPGDQEPDEVMLEIIDLGVEDIEVEEDAIVIITEPNEAGKIKEALKDREFEIREAKLTQEPKVVVEVTNRSHARQLIALMNELDEHDDVQDVYANFDIPDTWLDEDHD